MVSTTLRRLYKARSLIGSLLKIELDPTSKILYVLLLIADEAGKYEIYDPKENYAVIFASSSYDEVKFLVGEKTSEQVRERYQD